jgi:MerR family transcriptional regulator, light-induced transcriptional regulator
MYTIKQAAALSGVSVAVLRAWERRYRIVVPARTAAGYRLYDEPAIERIRAMRRLVDAGWVPSQAAHQIEADGVSPPGGKAGEGDGEGDGAGAAFPDAARTGAHDLAPRRVPAWSGQPVEAGSALIGAAASLDERRVESILDDLFATGSFERVLDDLVLPALRALGDAWASGVVSVAGEHMASHAVLRRVAASFEAAGLPGGDRPVLVGLPPGARHEIAALAFAAAARRLGLPVVYLGADVPADSWREALVRTRARAIVIGIPTPADRAAADEVLVATAAIDARPLIAVGGRGAVAATADASDAARADPRQVIRLPDGIGAAAAALDAALSAPR